MKAKFTSLNPSLYNYLIHNSLREHPVLSELRQETAALPKAVMQIAPDQGQFMQLMVKLTDARKILEIGTFTGYSSLAMALALPDNGSIDTCDVNEEWTAIAKRYWKKAEVDSKIKLHLAPALESLDTLLTKGAKGSYDLMFIDADKGNYLYYYEKGLTLLKDGGLMMLDNVLWEGDVINPHTKDPDALSIIALNEKIRMDKRVEISMIPIADGLTLARKKS